LLHTNQNTKHPTSFVKKTSRRHSLPHELCSLKFSYLQVFAFFIKLDFSAGVQMLFGLHYTVFKSMQEHFVSSYQWNNVNCRKFRNTSKLYAP